METTFSDFSYGLFILQTICFLILAIIIYTIIDLYKSDFTTDKKIIWLLAILFVPLIGCLVYHTVAKNPRVKQ